MDFIAYLTATGKKQQQLWKEADSVRRAHVGEKAHFRGIIEFSNICEKDCYYCGIRKSNEKVERYRMSLDEIKEGLAFIDKADYGSVVLQSGELTTPSAKKFALEVVRFIRKTYPEMGITLSLGELDRTTLKALKEAGAHRYLLRIETSVPSLYKKLHPTDHSYERRLECLKDLRELGYQVGCGNMVGTPGQTLEDLVADLKFFKEMDFDMFGLGPYVIHGDTPLATPANKKWWKENKEAIFNHTLNFIAVLRLMMPTANIASATALEAFDPLGRVMGLKVGANVIMPSVTPKKYRAKYLLYQGKPCIDEHAEMCKSCIVRKVRLANLHPALGETGTSLHYLKRTHGQA